MRVLSAGRTSSASRRLPALALALCILAAAASTVRPADDYDPSTLVYPPFGHCLGIHRATTFHLFVYLGARTRFEEPTGIAAVKLAVKDDPSTESDDDELTVFGLNTGRCEIIYNTSLVNVEIYGECGSGRGQFSAPLGIAADERGNVFVADTGNDRVVRLLYRDDELVFVKTLGSRGSDERQFSQPSQIAIGASGTVYVSDTGNDRIVIMTGEGEPVATIPDAPDSDRATAAEGFVLDGPVGLAVVEGGDPWITRKRDFLVVADRGGARLAKLGRDGTLQATVESGAPGLESARFDYLAIDYYGNVYATDSANSVIHKFDWTLTPVTTFGRHGTDDLELNEPRGIALWRRFGQIFVSERSGAQYFWIGTEIQDLTVSPDALTPGSEETRITYRLTETARVTIEIVDPEGEVVGTIIDNRRRAIGDNAERWTGTTGKRRTPLPSGRYTLRVTAKPTYSSGNYFHDTAEIQLNILTSSSD